MIFNSVSSFSLFFILLLSFIFSFFLYFYREKRLQELSINIRIFLFSLRFLSFFLILLLLLNPFIENKKEIIEKPILVVFQDNSSSIISNSDSLFYKNSYKEIIENFKFKVKEKFNVEFLLFGEEVREDTISFTDKFSNISSIFNYSENVFSNVNVGSYLLISDGIYNKGKNPKYLEKILNAPLHCLAIGDTVKSRDAFIHSVNHNKIGFPGNELPVEINLQVNNLKGEKIKLEVKSKKNIVFKKIIDVNSVDFLTTIPFYVKSNKSGLNKFDISLSLLSPKVENNISNNSSSFYIDIVNKEKEILMLYDFPHPDITALKSAIQLDQQYKIEINRISDVKKEINNYDLVILYQCDLSTSNLKKVRKNNIPIWYIIGPHSNVSKINSMQETVYFSGEKNDFNEQYVSFNETFQKFNLEKSVLELINNSPPLIMNYSYKINNDVKVVLNRQSKLSSKEKPICFFSRNNNECFLISEGIWRWRLNNFLKKSNHDSFNSLIIKIVKNLLIESDRDRLKLNFQSVYNFGESVVFKSELYNENLELVPSQEINLNLRDEENNEFNYSFISFGGDYLLNLGELNPGSYQFVVTTNYDGENFVKKGDFIVRNSLIEKNITIADHDLLYNLSKKNNGILFQLNEINSIENKILSSNVFKPVIHYENERVSLIGFIISLILIFIFLFLEWFFRKKFIRY